MGAARSMSWETFSSRVSRATRSSTRLSMGRAGSRKGMAAAALICSSVGGGGELSGRLRVCGEREKKRKSEECKMQAHVRESPKSHSKRRGRLDKSGDKEWRFACIFAASYSAN